VTVATITFMASASTTLVVTTASVVGDALGMASPLALVVNIPASLLDEA